MPQVGISMTFSLLWTAIQLNLCYAMDIRVSPLVPWSISGISRNGKFYIVKEKENATRLTISGRWIPELNDKSAMMPPAIMIPSDLKEISRIANWTGMSFANFNRLSNISESLLWEKQTQSNVKQRSESVFLGCWPPRSKEWCSIMIRTEDMLNTSGLSKYDFVKPIDVYLHSFNQHQQHRLVVFGIDSVHNHSEMLFDSNIACNEPWEEFHPCTLPLDPKWMFFDGFLLSMKSTVPSSEDIHCNFWFQLTYFIDDFFSIFHVAQETSDLAFGCPRNKLLYRHSLLDNEKFIIGCFSLLNSTECPLFAVDSSSRRQWTFILFTPQEESTQLTVTKVLLVLICNFTLFLLLRYCRYFCVKCFSCMKRLC